MSVRRFVVAALLTTAGAQAAPCGRPDVDFTFPPHGAAAVPSNAALSAHYASPARYDDEPVVLRDAADQVVGLDVRYDEALSVLQATPQRALEPGVHQLEWPGLRGAASGGLGQGRRLDFTVSAATDAASPKFSGLSGIDWDLSRERDPCLDRLDDRFVFHLEVSEAIDDADAELLTLLVFQTRDPTAPERVEPAQVALLPFPLGGSVELRRPATESGLTCFAAVARDLLGGVSGGGEREVCVTTQKPPFFDGCAVSPPRHPTGAMWVLTGLALLRARRGRGAKLRAR